MKITLTPSQIAEALYQDEYAGFSYDGAYALAGYLDQLDADSGVETELETADIRGAFKEYCSAIEAAEERGYLPGDDADDTEREEDALDWLRERMPVIGFDGGVIIETLNRY